MSHAYRLWLAMTVLGLSGFVVPLPVPPPFDNELSPQVDLCFCTMGGGGGDGICTIQGKRHRLVKDAPNCN